MTIKPIKRYSYQNYINFSLPLSPYNTDYGTGNVRHQSKRSNIESTVVFRSWRSCMFSLISFFLHKKTLSMLEDMWINCLNCRLCNMDIISQVQQVICFAFHDSKLLMETCQEAKNLRKIVTLFYLD